MYDMMRAHRDSEGQTPLHLAAMLDRPACVEGLMNFGADVMLRDDWDRTPLDLARENGHARVDLIIRRKRRHMMMEADSGSNAKGQAEMNKRQEATDTEEKLESLLA